MIQTDSRFWLGDPQESGAKWYTKERYHGTTRVYQKGERHLIQSCQTPTRTSDKAIRPAGRGRPDPDTGGRKLPPHCNTTHRTSKTHGAHQAPLLQDHPGYKEHPQQWGMEADRTHCAKSAEPQGTTETRAQRFRTVSNAKDTTT